MGFKEFLTEQMTTSDAMNVLGLSGEYDEKELKKAYRRASNKAHPDKGGSVDQQQNINAAYKVLQGTENGKDPISSFKNRRQEAKERAKVAEAYVVQLFNQYFQPSTYAEYFKKASGKDYTFEKSVTPNFNIGDYVSVVYKFTSSDRKTFFDVAFSCYIRFSKSLGGGNESTGLDYLGVSTSVLHERKKYKMSRRDYSNENSVQAIASPSKNFPKEKLKKVFDSNRKPVRRADYLLAFSKELKATKSGDFIRIPLKGDYEYVISRMTFMRQASYMSNGIYTTGRPRERLEILTTTFLESKNPEYLDDFIEGLQKIQKTSTPQSITRDLKVLQTRLERKYSSE